VLGFYYYQQAMAAERTLDYSAAIGLFRMCETLSGPDRGDVLFHLGWCIEQRDGVGSEEALGHYIRAAQCAHAPACRINSYFRAGWLLMHNKDREQAVEMYRLALAEGSRFDCRDVPYCHSLYWLGVCLEVGGNILEAIDCYRSVASLSVVLRPEADYRELMSLSAIGRYRDALRRCEEFPGDPPEGFDTQRFEGLRRLVRVQQTQLDACLSIFFNPARIRENHDH